MVSSDSGELPGLAVNLSGKRVGDRSLRVGLMADSHGDAGRICSAIELFRRRRCGRMYHLGDICDSLRPETADACIRPLQSANVIAIRGNNDHSLLANQKGRPTAGISDNSLAFLEGLPLKRSFGGAELVHSLPFTGELGLSSMVGSLAAADANRFFASSGPRILFRAHGHSPELMWRRKGRPGSRTLLAGETVDLGSYRPCIVTCGALIDGFCLLWKPARDRVTCLELQLTRDIS
jgi:hypothetical protein